MDKYQFKGQVEEVIQDLEKDVEKAKKHKRGAGKGSYQMGYHTGSQDALVTAIDRLKSLAVSLPDIRSDHDL
jgi:hypothetical protein